LDQIALALKSNPNDATLQNARQHEEQRLVEQAAKIKGVDVVLTRVVDDLYATNLLARWNAVSARLREGGYSNVLSVPSAAGLVLDPSSAITPRVGLWIMPNNQVQGILEDFLRFLIPQGDSLFQHATSSVQQIPEGRRLFVPQDTRKAEMHTWLAWQAEPGRPYGTAITAGFLNDDCPEADTLIAWLRRLFFQPIS